MNSACHNWNKSLSSKLKALSLSFTLVVASLSLLPHTASAHSGRTDNRGCHFETATRLTHCHRREGQFRESRRLLRHRARVRRQNVVNRRVRSTRAQDRAETARVIEVIDGDTIRVRLANWHIETVRFIGIDTPELWPRQCYSYEAKRELERLVASKQITLHRGDTNRDKFNRLLRFVHRDGRDIGAKLLKSGHAKNFPWFSHARKGQYSVLEERAKRDGKGVWGEC